MVLAVYNRGKDGYSGVVGYENSRLYIGGEAEFWVSVIYI